MEKADNAAVIPINIDWSDIGSWKALDEIKQNKDRHNNFLDANSITIDAKNNYVLSTDKEKPVAIIGIEDAIVVETESGLLVCKKEQAQQVKKIVNRLKERYGKKAVSVSSHNNFFSKELIDKVVNTIVKNEHPEKIILFGSYANGTTTKDSDIDLLIIKKKVKSKIKETKKVRELLRTIRIPKDILLITSEDYNFYRKESGSIFKDIDKEGIVLYE